MDFIWSIDDKTVSWNDIIAISPTVAYKAQWCTEKFLKFQDEFPETTVFLNYSTAEEMFKATTDIALLMQVSSQIADEKSALVN